MAGIGQCKHCGQMLFPIYDKNNKVIYNEHRGPLPCIIINLALDMFYKTIK